MAEQLVGPEVVARGCGTALVSAEDRAQPGRGGVSACMAGPVQGHRHEKRGRLWVPRAEDAAAPRSTNLWWAGMLRVPPDEGMVGLRYSPAGSVRWMESRALAGVACSWKRRCWMRGGIRVSRRSSSGISRTSIPVRGIRVDMVLGPMLRALVTSWRIRSS
jgi:hypothetical protein